MPATPSRRAGITGAGERDVTVSFGGVTFTPGQRLVADEDSVVLLPAGLTEDRIDVSGALAATAAYVSTGRSSA